MSINSSGVTREGAIEFDYGNLQLKLNYSSIASLDINDVGVYHELTISGITAVAVGICVVVCYKGAVALATATTVGTHILCGNAS